MTMLSLTERVDLHAREKLLFLKTLIARQPLIPLKKIVADHICYNCENSARYAEYFEAYNECAVLEDESIIGGRKIAYFRLKSRIDTIVGDIIYIELCDQKPDGSQREGVDHVEAYVRSNADLIKIVAGLDEVKPVVKKPRGDSFVYVFPLAPSFNLILTEIPLILKIEADREKANAN